MSIHSGFATKNLESQYTQTVCKLLHLCQLNLLSLLKNGTTHSEHIDFLSLSTLFPKLFLTLKALEHQKSIEPKFSLYCSDLATFFNCSPKPPPKNDESNSSKNFDLLLLNESFANETLVKDSSKGSNFSYMRTRSSQKTRISSRKPSHFVPNRLRPTSSKPGQCSSNSSRKSFVSRTREKIDPSRYYHDKALELISEGMDGFYEGS